MKMDITRDNISLESVLGMQLLKESTACTSFFELIRYFQPQKNLAFCGVTSSVICLNALNVTRPNEGPHEPYPFFTQENFFTQKVSAVKTSEDISQEGMNLMELSNILNTFEGAGVVVNRIYASESDCDTFRKLAITHLSGNSHYILINYLRRALGQESGGHISPLAAYHSSSDSFLILDVSQYKYPPIWVSSERLWKSMSTIVDDDVVSRGFVIVSKAIKL